ncbi:oligosaccharide flippase family protein [Paenibacillus sp. FSL H8-0259]|uniref:oligosaccharide flippase family protein n=1 Tax=Paenibacillus sp. FSL H8-0259 TaxID=1920423 RepID=UPI002116BDE2|nr:oligosaccharide flippase family protein [Paenibacillus sp. FSL H8-0259]
MNKKFSTVITNVFYAFSAQGISFLLSVILSLIVPKVLGVEEFSYWQLSIFYMTYLGFFHFGLNDGIYLRLGGAEYGRLDYKSLGSQFWIAFIFHCVIGCSFIIYSLLFIDDWKRQFVFITTGIYLPLINAIGFIGYIFQSVNKTKLFSLSVIIDKLWFIIVVIILLICKNDNFIWFVILDIVGKLASITFLIWNGRIIIISKPYFSKKIFKEIYNNVSVGINLMFSNVAGLFILGSGRFVVDKNWGIEVFGVFSLAVTLATFLLSFIAQISMVLFPALRQSNEEQQKRIFGVSREILGLILPGFLLVYMPLYYILNLWLPQYKESLVYLIFLLPLCVYEGKMNLLCTTYFKVLRLEKKLLKINLISLSLSILLAVLGGYLINNIYVVVLSSVVAIAFRSIVSEFHLMKLIGGKALSGVVEESLLVLIFVGATWFTGPFKGFIIYSFCYGVYLICSKNKIKTTLYFLKKYIS